MKIFITGSESFVARELIQQSDKHGYELTGCDVREPKDLRFKKADISEKEISAIIPDDLDVLIHLAALSTDKLCKDNEYECFAKNVMGTLNLIGVAEKKQIKQFIFASTEWVYGTFENNKEKSERSTIDIQHMESEYALSKIVSECNLRQKFRSGFCDTTILRFGIIYGRRMTNWSAVESILNTIRQEDIVKVGSLRSGRHFIHVRDIAHGIVKSIGLKGFNIVNLQGDRLISLGEIIRASKNITGRDILVEEIKGSDYDVKPISNMVAKRLLGWAPNIGLDEGLRDLAKFFESQL